LTPRSRRPAANATSETSAPVNDPGCARHQCDRFRILHSGGLPEAVFNLAMGGEVQCYISEPIVAEYEDVLRRPRLAINPDKVRVALARIRAAASLVQPLRRVTVALDPDNNIFLECAEAAQAHYLVTGNARHFPERWGETRIVTPRQFMDDRALASDEPG
jgi:predicted nucleic acid-binding protein